jgi:hypothetical protein
MVHDARCALPPRHGGMLLCVDPAVLSVTVVPLLCCVYATSILAYYCTDPAAAAAATAGEGQDHQH